MYTRLAWKSPQHPEYGECRCVSSLHLALSVVLFPRLGPQEATWKTYSGPSTIPRRLEGERDVL